MKQKRIVPSHREIIERVLFSADYAWAEVEAMRKLSPVERKRTLPFVRAGQELGFVAGYVYSLKQVMGAKGFERLMKSAGVSDEDVREFVALGDVLTRAHPRQQQGN